MAHNEFGELWNAFMNICNPHDEQGFIDSMIYRWENLTRCQQTAFIEWILRNTESIATMVAAITEHVCTDHPSHNAHLN